MARGRGRARNAAGKKETYAELLLMAFVFLGLGIGLAFGQAGPGLMIGAGVGVLAMGFTRIEEERERNKALQSALGVASYIIFLIGIYIIAIAIALLYGVSVLNPYFASVPLVVIGLILLILYSKKREL